MYEGVAHSTAKERGTLVECPLAGLVSTAVDGVTHLVRVRGRVRVGVRVRG